ncbi:MAG TPA: DUF4159 domain-containing protein [Caldithrix sp.]|nr:DUF4159 domain-containing protein [Calditrichaceae bacterium]HEM48881.1 DUF4159 domain-containing protein [Caldithrix sp.]
MTRFLILILLLLYPIRAQDIKPVRIHYNGGGDWYGNKTTWINILDRVHSETGLNVSKQEAACRISDVEFNQYPIAYIAGHGNISFDEDEIIKLRSYLIHGGFLIADDDYGMNLSFRREMKKVFPELNFVELPFSHLIYHIHYHFDQGLPKIHEHDGGPPKGYGLIYEGRLVCFYSFNTDLSDGCENQEIHNDPPEKHEQALRMMVNIVLYALIN